MMGWLERVVYRTEEKFGFERYRKPIVWFDKMLVLLGMLAGVAGRMFGAIWVLQLATGQQSFTSLLPLLTVAVLLWVPGEYFCRTGNRGLIYHHMDILADYLDRKLASTEQREN